MRKTQIINSCFEVPQPTFRLIMYWFA